MPYHSSLQRILQSAVQHDCRKRPHYSDTGFKRNQGAQRCHRMLRARPSPAQPSKDPPRFIGNPLRCVFSYVGADMSLAYGPWIEHDGKGFPHAIWGDAVRQGAVEVQRAFRNPHKLRKKTPLEQAHHRKTDPDSPVWTWSFKRSFLPPVTRRRVCADPAYAPVVKYRFRYEKPPAVEKSAQVEMLREIVSKPPSGLIGEDA